ncbi:MAG: tRNA (guanosine(37)-N1)-methyltransferase TrmD, partial [Syntrophomonadaceae bacterium]
MIIDILTLFPDMFVSPFSESIIKRAQERDLVSIRT